MSTASPDVPLIEQYIKIQWYQQSHINIKKSFKCPWSYTSILFSDNVCPLLSFFIKYNQAKNTREKIAGFFEKCIIFNDSLSTLPLIRYYSECRVCYISSESSVVYTFITISYIYYVSHGAGFIENTMPGLQFLSRTWLEGLGAFSHHIVNCASYIKKYIPLFSGWHQICFEI